MNEIIDDQFNWNFPPNTFGADEGQSGTETIFSDEDNLGRKVLKIQLIILLKKMKKF